MAARGTTFAKQERDRAKKAKAALKRERREARSGETDEEPVPSTSGEGDIPPDQLLRMVEELHKAYADERISLEEFEERKQDLMSRITV